RLVHALGSARSFVLAVSLVAHPLDRHDALALRRVEDDDALGGAARDPNALHGAADQLAAIGDQHDLIRLIDRGGSAGRTVALIDHHRGDALAAALGDPELIGRGALSVAVFRDRQDDLLGRAHGGVALLAEFDRAGLLRVGLGGALLDLPVRSLAGRGPA